MSDTRYFIKVGNCYVDFIGAFHDVKLRSDYHKAAPYLTEEKATKDAKMYCRRHGIKNFQIVQKSL